MEFFCFPSFDTMFLYFQTENVDHKEGQCWIVRKMILNYIKLFQQNLFVIRSNLNIISRMLDNRIQHLQDEIKTFA